MDVPPKPNPLNYFVAGCPTTPDKVMSQKQLRGDEGRRGLERLCHGHPLKDVPVFNVKPCTHRLRSLENCGGGVTLHIAPPWSNFN